MQVLRSHSAVLEFCKSMRPSEVYSPTPMMRGVHIPCHNNELTEQALGWPFRLVTRRVNVTSLSPDWTLQTLLTQLAVVVCDMLPAGILDHHSMRGSCFLSRSLARQITHIVRETIDPIILGTCPMCQCDVCLRGDYAACMMCDRPDIGGPLPIVTEDSGGVSPEIEALLAETLADSQLMLLYTAKEDGEIVHVADWLTFDDPDVASRNRRNEIELQVFVRQPADDF